MTLFQLCMYTIYANQAIQAVGYFVLANDPHGIFHFLAPIAYPIGYIMNIQHGEIHRFSEFVLRNEKKCQWQYRFVADEMFYRAQLFCARKSSTWFPAARNGISARNRWPKMWLFAGTELVELWFWSETDNFTPRKSSKIYRLEWCWWLLQWSPTPQGCHQHPLSTSM